MARLCTQCPLTRTVLYIARFNQTNEGRTEKQISGFAALDHPQIIFYIYATNFNLMWYLNFCWALKKNKKQKTNNNLGPGLSFKQHHHLDILVPRETTSAKRKKKKKCCLDHSASLGGR